MNYCADLEPMDINVCQQIECIIRKIHHVFFRRDQDAHAMQLRVHSEPPQLSGAVVVMVAEGPSEDGINPRHPKRLPKCRRMRQPAKCRRAPLDRRRSLGRLLVYPITRLDACGEDGCSRVQLVQLRPDARIATIGLRPRDDKGVGAAKRVWGLP